MCSKLSTLTLSLLLFATTAQAEVSLTGPTEPVEVGELCKIFVQGIEHEALPQAVLKWWPRENVQVEPAMTWAGEPFIFFRSKVPGKFFLWVAVLREGNVDYAEIIINVSGSIPDPPEPTDLAEYVQKITKKVQSTSHVEVSGVFQSLITEIEKGKLRGSSQILNETSTKLFGERREEHREWIDWWNTLAQHLLDMKLVTNNQWAEAYGVVGTVLKGENK